MFHPSIAGEISGLLPLAGAVEPQAAAGISQTQHKPCGAFRAGREVRAIVQRIFLRESRGGIIGETHFPPGRNHIKKVM